MDFEHSRFSANGVDVFAAANDCGGAAFRGDILEIFETYLDMAWFCDKSGSRNVKRIGSYDTDAEKTAIASAEVPFVPLAPADAGRTFRTCVLRMQRSGGKRNEFHVIELSGIAGQLRDEFLESHTAREWCGLACSLISAARAM